MMNLKEIEEKLSKIKKPELPEAFLVPNAVKDVLLRDSRELNKSELEGPITKMLGVFPPCRGIEMLSCDGMPEDEWLQFDKKEDAHKFVETAKRIGYKSAKELFTDRSEDANK